jgi:hypothetical protein
MGRRGLTDDQMWPSLRERARRLNDTHGRTAVPQGMALVRSLNAAAATLGVFPPREFNSMTALIFRTKTLHDFAEYATSAYSVRESIKTLIGKRKKLLSLQDGDVTRIFDEAFALHNDTPANGALYAISNVVRHDIRPDTINTVTNYKMVGGGQAEVSVTVRLGMAGLMDGQGWNDARRNYVGPEGQVELLPLVDDNLMSLSRLVIFVTTSIHEEFHRTGRR